MRNYSYIISLFLGLCYQAFSVNINYNTLEGFTTASSCIITDENSVPKELQSPIVLSNTICEPYQNFTLSMSDVNAVAFDGDDVRGSLYIPYTGTTIMVDGTSYTSVRLTFRHKAEHISYYGSPYEPAVPTNRADLEMQIEMQSAAGDNGVLAFLFVGFNPADTSATNKAKILAYNSINAITSITSTTYTLSLSSIADAINEKVSKGLYLNMFSYTGTFTYPSCEKAVWFIYGPELYTDSANVVAFASALVAEFGSSPNIVLNTTDNQNARPWTNQGLSVANGAGSGVRMVYRLCFTGYFDVYLNWNYGLWWAVVTLLLYFIINLTMGEKQISDPDYVENTWTAHPWVSVYRVGNEIFTRKTRTSIILMTLTIHALFTSAFFRQSDNKTQPANIIVYAVYSMIISQVITFYFGWVVRRYYVAKSQFLKTKQESWNEHAQNRLFAFYFSVFAVTAIGWPFTVWNMSFLQAEVDTKASDYWVAAWFVGLAFEWLLLDIALVYLARASGFFKNIAKKKGFFYDDLCHQTYLDYIKQD